MRLNNSSKVTRAAILAALALLTAACTPDAEPTTTPTSSTTSSTTTSSRTTNSPSPTVDPDMAAAEAAILEAYRGYWATKVAILADPQAEPGTELETYAIDTGLTDVYTALLSLRSSRIYMVGEPVLHPEVSDVVAGDQGTATITDCVDVAEWQPFYQDSNDSAAVPGQATDVLTISTAEVYSGRWVISASTVERDTAC